MAFFSVQADGVLLRCLIQPQASRDEIVGLQDDRLKIRIAAPPVDGKANAQLIRFLAGHFNLPRAQIEVLRGESGKRKTVKLHQLTTLPLCLHALLTATTDTPT